MVRAARRAVGPAIALAFVGTAYCHTYLQLAEERRVAVCMTSKIGNTVLPQYMKHVQLAGWASHGAPLACRQDLPCIKGRELACRNVNVSTLDKHNESSLPKCENADDARYRLDVPPRVGSGTYKAQVPKDCLLLHHQRNRSTQQLAANWTVVVPTRDPWARLWSGFVDKVLPHFSAQGCHAKTGKLSALSTLNACHRSNHSSVSWHQFFLEAVAKHFQNDILINHHFAPQAQQCLHATLRAQLAAAGAHLVFAPIERGGLEHVARAMQGPPFKETAPKGWSEMCDHYDHMRAPTCGRVRVETVRQVLDYLQQDYAALGGVSAGYKPQAISAALNASAYSSTGRPRGVVQICDNGTVSAVDA